MAIPIILKGDTTATIFLKLADGYDNEGVWLDVSVFGVTRTMTLPEAGSTIELTFTAAETSKAALGTHKVLFTIRNERGDKKSLPWAKIKVTDAPSEVASPVISIDPATIGDIEATVGDKLGDVKVKLNKLISLLRGGALALAVIISSAYGVELTPTTTLNEIPGTATLSNMVAAAGVTIGGNAGTDGEAVTNIVEGMIIFKRDMYDLSFGGEYCWEITDGEDVIFATYQLDNKYYFQGNFALHKWYQVVEVYDEKTKQYKVIFSTLGMTPTSPPGITKEVTSDAPITSFDFGTIKGVKKRLAKDTIALKSDLPTEAQLKTIAGAALNRTYDVELGITWRKEARGGAFFEVCETNINTAVIR